MLSWDAPRGGATVVSYEYRHAEISAALPANWTGVTPAGATEATITSLTVDMTYRFQVRSVGVLGTPTLMSPGTTPVTAMTLADPGVPTGFEATAGDTMVTLEWKAPVPAPAGISYEYRYGSASTVTSAEWMSATGREATVTGLTNGTTYSFQVRSRNPGMGAVSSSTLNGTATPAALPSVPTNLSATRTVAMGVLTVTLDWAAPSSTGGPGITITNYEYRTVGRTTWTRLSTGTITVAINGLDPDLPYTFEVRAVNVTGVGPAASVMSGATAGAPSAPQNLVAVAGNGHVTLTWAAPTTGAPILRYEYMRMDVGVWMSTAMALTTTVTGLTNGTPYVFQVRAVNATGEGVAASVTATPSTTPPTTTLTAKTSLEVAAAFATALATAAGSGEEWNVGDPAAIIPLSALFNGVPTSGTVTVSSSAPGFVTGTASVSTGVVLTAVSNGSSTVTVTVNTVSTAPYTVTVGPATPPLVPIGTTPSSKRISSVTVGPLREGGQAQATVTLTGPVEPRRIFKAKLRLVGQMHTRQRGVGVGTLASQPSRVVGGVRVPLTGELTNADYDADVIGEVTIQPGYRSGTVTIETGTDADAEDERLLLQAIKDDETFTPTPMPSPPPVGRKKSSWSRIAIHRAMC